MPVCNLESWTSPGVIDRACSSCMCSVRVYSVGGEIPTAPLAWCLDLDRKASQTAKKHLAFLHCTWLLCRDFGLELWDSERKQRGRITGKDGSVTPPVKRRVLLSKRDLAIDLDIWDRNMETAREHVLAAGNHIRVVFVHLLYKTEIILSGNGIKQA